MTRSKRQGKPLTEDERVELRRRAANGESFAHAAEAAGARVRRSSDFWRAAPSQSGKQPRERSYVCRWASAILTDLRNAVGSSPVSRRHESRLFVTGGDAACCKGLFSAPQERAVLLIAFGIAHTSQFVTSVPIARWGGRVGESYWDVLGGTMLFTFVVDALMALLNFAYALCLTAA